jgi:hypothetical protein
MALIFVVDRQYINNGIGHHHRGLDHIMGKDEFFDGVIVFGIIVVVVHFIVNQMVYVGAVVEHNGTYIGIIVIEKIISANIGVFVLVDMGY